jgi:hypothetical protein
VEDELLIAMETEQMLVDLECIVIGPVPSVACAALAMTIGWHLIGGHFDDREGLSLKVVQAAVSALPGQRLLIYLVNCGARGIGS